MSCQESRVGAFPERLSVDGALPARAEQQNTAIKATTQTTS
jgi:hypothetical protein